MSAACSATTNSLSGASKMVHSVLDILLTQQNDTLSVPIWIPTSAQHPTISDIKSSIIDVLSLHYDTDVKDILTQFDLVMRIGYTKFVDLDQYLPINSLLIARFPCSVDVTPKNSTTRSAISFTKFDASQLINLEDMTLPWQKTAPGLSLEAFCTNKRCKASGKAVVVNIGFTLFDLKHDISKFQCPVCSEGVQPFTVGLNNCRWRYVGTLAGGNQVESKDWEDVGNHYKRFRGTGDHRAMYESLWVEAIKINENLHPSNVCVLCNVDLGSHPSSLGCVHRLHTLCKKNWERSCQQRHIPCVCPICQEVFYEPKKAPLLQNQREILNRHCIVTKNYKSKEFTIDLKPIIDASAAAVMTAFGNPLSFIAGLSQSAEIKAHYKSEKMNFHQSLDSTHSVPVWNGFMHVEQSLLRDIQSDSKEVSLFGIEYSRSKQESKFYLHVRMVHEVCEEGAAQYNRTQEMKSTRKTVSFNFKRSKALWETGKCAGKPVDISYQTASGNRCTSTIQPGQTKFRLNALLEESGELTLGLSVPEGPSSKPLSLTPSTKEEITIKVLPCDKYFKITPPEGDVYLQYFQDSKNC